MSIQRQMRRALYRKAGKEWPSATTPTKPLKDGGYEALRPTKGWLRVSAKRLRAQGRLRALIERLTLRRA